MNNIPNPDLPVNPITARIERIRTRMCPINAVEIIPDLGICARCNRPYPVLPTEEVSLLALRRLIGTVCMECRTPVEMEAYGAVYATIILRRLAERQRDALKASLVSLYEFMNMGGSYQRQPETWDRLLNEASETLRMCGDEHSRGKP